MPAIMGLDLSVRAAAACIVPTDWGGDWNRVITRVSGCALPRGATENERAWRCIDIAMNITGFANCFHVSQVWIEGYAFGQNTAANTLGEVGGVVRAELAKLQYSIRTANMSTARKLLLGKLPKKGAKVAAREALRAAGAPDWTLDECDAFVAANLGLCERGAFCFAQKG